MGITKKQKEIFDYIRSYWLENGFTPGQKEIKDHFKFKSYGSVQRYIKYLSNAGYIETDWNARRGIKVLGDPTLEERLRQQVDQGGMPHTHSAEQQVDAKTIPLLGLVAAGNPIEAIENYDQTISIPSSMVKSGKQYFALTVQGDSMIEDGILEDDVIICEHAPKARTGQTVVAVIDGEATVKKFHQHDEKNNIIELHPANSRLSPILVTPEQDFKFAGIVVGLFRNLY